MKHKKIKIVVGGFLAVTVVVVAICFYIIKAVNEVANALEGGFLD